MRQRFACVLLLAALAVCYGQLLLSSESQFVYDDARFVSTNEAVQDLRNAGRYFSDPTTVDPSDWAGIYRPLRTFDFAVDWALAGDSPWWFHLRSILYHALGTFLVYSLLRRWKAGDGPALLGALVFAIHPVQVESVAWITSRGDVMCLVLTLLALYIHQSAVGWGRRSAGALSVLALALLAKESAAVFPGLAVLSDFFFRDERKLKKTLRRWPQYLSYVILVGLYVALWIGMHQAYGGNKWHLNGRWGGSLLGTIFVMSCGFVYYARLLFFPVDMALDWYPAPFAGPDALSLLCLGLVVAVLGIAVVRAFRNGGAFAFGILWFFIAMFPTSNLAGPIGIPTAERFLYLPIVGLMLGVGLVLHRVWRTAAWGRVVVVTLLVCVGVVTIERTKVWQTDAALWGATLARYVSPRGLGWKANRLRVQGEDLQTIERILRDEDRREEAELAAAETERHFKDSIDHYDRQIVAWDRLPQNRAYKNVARALRAVVLYDMGRHAAALAEAEATLEEWPDLIWGRYARALALFGLGRLREARDEIEFGLAVRYTPQFRHSGAGIHLMLSKWYLDRGNRAMAFRSLQRSWKLYPSTKGNGAAFKAIREMEEQYKAVTAPLLAAVDADDADGVAWLQLALNHARFGNWEESGRIFEWLMGQDQVASSPAALHPYALYHWQWRDTEEGYRRALAIYDRILEIEPDFPGAAEDRDRCRAQLQELLAEGAR